MRLPPRQRRSVAPQPHRLGCAILALASLAPSISQAFEFTPAASPNLDFSNLGRIGVAGDFSGISLYEYQEQNGRPPSRNGSESLLATLPNGALASIVSTDASIRTMCTFKLSNGETQGVVIGGNFTSLDGTQSTAVALYNPETGKVTSFDGLEGEVNAVYCDEERDTVYVGGNFKGADSTNAMAWVDGDGWTNLPFAGFNGPVEAISKASNGHIIFGGSFTGLGNASTPSEPDGQVINLSSAKLSAQSSASGNNDDPKSIVCSKDSERSTWLVQDNTPGFWDAEFGFGFEPTKLRLWNTHQDGRGTKTFRFLAFPLNGIMNFTYVDPGSGEKRSCTSECPLSDDPSVEFQDFQFVNNVGMNHFQLAISEWYGAGAGLDGIELFQDSISSYAIKEFNDPACKSIDFPSTATATGPWKDSPSLQSSSRYLTAEVSADADASSDSTSVVFIPNIKESGNYSINIYTPGCQPDGSCERRGRVNVTGTMSAGQGGVDFSQILSQTNNYDKYDQIYFGYVDKSSDSFRPTVTLSPIPDNEIKDQVVVAQRVGFTLTNSTGGLNGLFDFDPSKKEFDSSDFEKSAINKLGSSFDQNTGVKTLLTSDDITFIGGNFTSEDHENIVAINSDNKVQHLDGGLNGQVLSLHINGTKLYVGGDFNNTLNNAAQGLNHVVVYDVEKDTWNSLGAGVDGRVQYVVPLQINITDDSPETVIAFTGSFSQCNEFGDSKAIPANGLAIWVPSQDSWLQNLDGRIPSYSGVLTAALMDLPNDEYIYAGSISYAQIGANGAATLDDEGLGQFPLTIRSQRSSSQLQRRDIFSEDYSGVETGLFHDDDDQDLTILAGHFTAQSSNGSTIHNLVIIDGKDDDSISGLGDGISEDSSFVALEIGGNTLYAGGKISGIVDGSDISGIVAYDLESRSFGGQPPSVTGGNGTVAAISVRPESDTQVFVGGSFTRAGALDCPGICLYNSDSRQWIRPGSGVGGDIYCLMWSSKETLVVGGNLQNSTGQTSLAIYKPDDEAWEAYPGASAIPGPVEAITPGSSDNNQIWVSGTTANDGSVFLMKHDGEEWSTVKHSLGSDTVIRSLQVFTVTESHDESDLLGDKEVLMITGSIELPDFGMASAAIYNGTTFEPYALTTSSSSNPGSIARIFSQKDNFFSAKKHHMALGFIVLIGLAISLGIIILLVAAGIVLDRLRKKREGYTPAPTSMYDRSSGMKRIPPQELLQSLGQGHPGAPHV